MKIWFLSFEELDLGLTGCYAALAVCHSFTHFYRITGEDAKEDPAGFSSLSYTGLSANLR